jgi:hypothetical protein
MTVEATVHKRCPDISANQEEKDEDGRFYSGSPPMPRERRAAGKAL